MVLAYSHFIIINEDSMASAVRFQIKRDLRNNFFLTRELSPINTCYCIKSCAKSH